MVEENSSDKPQSLNLPKPDHIVEEHARLQSGSRSPHSLMADQFEKMEFGAPEGLKPTNQMQSSTPSTTPSLSHSQLSPEPSNNVDNDSAQVITPWDVQGAVVDGKTVAVDYDKLILQFGTKPVDKSLLERFERLTQRKAHVYLRRGMFFSHRELDRILDRYEQGKPFYLYTGRGPSSDSMHLGHMIPFMFTKWLQDVFNCPLVIQLTDDEKFLFKSNLKIEQTQKFASENAKDIVALGFNPDKTLIFSDFDFVGGPFYHNVVRISKLITYNQAKAAFGFNESDSIGKIHFCSIQAAPSFSNSFPNIFGSKHDIPCLIPCAIDQDPYFRITRDVAAKLKYPKPALLHSKFFPALQGSQTKMSASDTNSSIYMTDKPNEIKNKMNKHAFSGGQALAEDHRKYGGNPDVDVSYQYLGFLMDDDDEYKKIAEEYRAGNILSGEMKKLCIGELQKFVANFQEAKSKVTNEMLQSFMDPQKIINGFDVLNTQTK
ncbi:hypothetical protein E3P92_01403 [Wallemia ichthyophaga]|uniref:Tryptophan--tRNA ligase, cytoplasmic n=1 Tax=Wallemia ichthyophaga (strain EXF-994 / CBS 113033) TaxID=1299270 RepID=R9AK11_WALI9|nr:Tryptophan--tRNA ligase, cytoplasmic [Wallemia ichthyophaga EXF-994]EOR00376.1 Tryptophan--tRNA ligase, cytoplasmic [Wallemia ichthyophaga EXF-994]TIB16131.1 hypothetical protein E3P92_01403 [Wallemia ichthyophaga]TIB39076.1 hypothetical protein E3P83_03670 [Wallemia ichthyophaga]